MNLGVIGIVISVVSATLSATTLWLTVLRRGRLAMTMPSVVFFGFDEVPHRTPKVFMRTLLYSTASNGQTVEAMYAVIHRHGGRRCTFSFWGYDEGSKLVPGSGLFVARSGVAANHHFVQSVRELGYHFEPGDYTVEVFARLVGRRPVRMAAIHLHLSHANAHALANGSGVLFEREPDTLEYVGHINSDRKLPQQIPYG